MERKIIVFIFCLTVIFTQTYSSQTQEPVYWDVVQKIREEAFEHSQVMENASWLCDVFGPRNAKTQAYIDSAEWAKKRLEEYGLSQARLEPYEFGIGWSNEYTSVHMISPQYLRIIAYPAAWSAGTRGKIRNTATYIKFHEMKTEAELEPYKGKLQDAIVFIKPPQEITPHYEPIAKVYSKDQLDEMAKIRVGPRASERRRRRAREGLTETQIIDFVIAQGAAAVVRTDGRNDFGTVDGAVNGYAMEKRAWDVDAPPPVTEVVMAAEHYNRILRIMEKGIPVELEMEIKVKFTKGEPVDYNVIAEIPGTDLAHEFVLCGGHLQSEPIGTGASDNAAGAVTAMEAVRILKAIGVKPRRTIRIGLWGGHEMGLYGNRHHVRTHFADPKTGERKPDYENFCAYFNCDNGGGRIRGVSIMENEVIRSILTEWIKPLKPLGMTHLFTTGMAHEAYTEVGLPGFYFVQDRMDNRTYHSNMDVYDHLVPENLMANSVILATIVYHAAMRQEKFPHIKHQIW